MLDISGIFELYRMYLIDLELDTFSPGFKHYLSHIKLALMALNNSEN